MGFFFQPKIKALAIKKEEKPKVKAIAIKKREEADEKSEQEDVDMEDNEVNLNSVNCATYSYYRLGCNKS